MSAVEWTDEEREAVAGHGVVVGSGHWLWGCECGEEFHTSVGHDRHVREAVLDALAPFVAAREAQAAAKAKERATDEYDVLLTLQSDLLEATVNILRGDPPGQTQWSHHDVAERTQRLKAERDRLAATVARVEALAYRWQREEMPDPTTADIDLRAALAGDQS